MSLASPFYLFLWFVYTFFFCSWIFCFTASTGASVHAIITQFSVAPIAITVTTISKVTSDNTHFNNNGFMLLSWSCSCYGHYGGKTFIHQRKCINTFSIGILHKHIQDRILCFCFPFWKAHFFSIILNTDTTH